MKEKDKVTAHFRKTFVLLFELVGTRSNVSCGSPIRSRQVEHANQVTADNCKIVWILE